LGLVASSKYPKTVMKGWLMLVAFSSGGVRPIDFEAKITSTCYQDGSMSIEPS
jgi:hypothetical protein